MRVEKMILVVSPTPSIAHALASSARRAGYTPVLVRSFSEGKRHLAGGIPHLLVTELKLAEYNGLHLALRAGTVGIPSIVVADASFEQEIEQFGATWVSPALAAASELSDLMTELVQGARVSASGFGWEQALSDWEPWLPTISH